MKILDLPLKAKWYDMIESGAKGEEYRIIKPYWCKRLSHCETTLCWMRGVYGTCRWVDKLQGFNAKNYTHVRFRFGYTKRTMLFELRKISIGKGKPEWGAPTDKDVFILTLGNRKE